MQPQSSANGLQLPIGFLVHFPPWHQQKMCPPKKAQRMCASAPLHLCTNFGGTAYIKVFFFRELAHMLGIWKYCHRPCVRFAAFLTSVKEVLPAAKILHHWMKRVYHSHIWMSLGSYNLRTLVNCIFQSQFAESGEMAQQVRTGGHWSPVTCLTYLQESFEFSFLCPCGLWGSESDAFLCLFSKQLGLKHPSKIFKQNENTKHAQM